VYTLKEKLKNTRQRLKQISQNKSYPTLVLIEETFYDLFSPLKFFICMCLMLIYPLIEIFAPVDLDFSAISIHHAASFIAIVMTFPLFFWTFGIILTSIIGFFGAPLISEEVNNGTIVILISKPIKRYKIFLGKYIALLIFALLLSFCTIFLLGWISVLRYSGNIFHFFGISPFLFSVLLYAVVISLIFVSITLAFSSIFKNPRSPTIVVFLFVIIPYIGFFFLRELIHFDYVNLQLYHFDLGYHLANVYVMFIELFNALPPSIGWQSTFADVYSVYSYLGIVDADQNIVLGGLEKTNYYLPSFSLLIWLIIAVLLLLYGIFSLQKREFSS